MRRAYAPLIIRGPNGESVQTAHAVGWTKPGTPLDAVIRADRKAQLEAAYVKYGVKAPRMATGNKQAARLARQAERNVERQCERGYVCLNGEWLHLRSRGRGLRPVFPGELEPLVAVKGVVSGHVLDGAMTIGE